MVIGLLKETAEEQRVALLPESVAALVKLKASVVVEQGAGIGAFATDTDYQAAGATVAEKKQVIDQADVLVKIAPPTEDELALMREKQVLVDALNPLMNTDMVKVVQQLNLTVFSLDSIPRTTRAQAMDILSSMATIAGYKAVLTAASELPKFFPLFMTAAGTIRPAKVLILGAGVAGLQAIATARRLGAVVEAFDVRAAVKEEVKSLGAKFVEVQGAKDDSAAGGYAVEQTQEYKKRQQELIQKHSAKANVIICTAQIPGRKAPLLVKKETLEKMPPGSVVIDLAASTGGNCEVTQNNKTVVHHTVKVIGNSNFPAQMPTDASQMFGQNVVNFLKLIIDKEGGLNLNFEDDIVKGTCITHGKELYNERVKSIMEKQ